MARVINLVSVEACERYMGSRVDSDKVVTILDAKVKYLHQGKVVYVSSNYAVLQGSYNIRESVLFADLVSGERMIG